MPGRQQEHGLAAFPWLGLCLLPLLLVGWIAGDQAGILWTWINPEAQTIEASNVTTVSEDVLHQKKQATQILASSLSVLSSILVFFVVLVFG